MKMELGRFSKYLKIASLGKYRFFIAGKDLLVSNSINYVTNKHNFKCWLSALVEKLGRAHS